MQDFLGSSGVSVAELHKENQDFLVQKIVEKLLRERVVDLIVKDFEHFRLDFCDFSILACQLHLVSDVTGFAISVLHGVWKEEDDAHVDNVLRYLICNVTNVVLALLYRLL